MSIIRENQIRQILDDENILKRQVIDREKRGIRNYEENIKPPQILDTKIIDENKGKINNLLSYLNTVYLRLRFVDEGQFLEILADLKKNEYRKYIELLNIVKPFQLWEQIMIEYTDPKLNQTTREQIKSNIQKLSSYIDEICVNISKIITCLCAIWLSNHGIKSPGVPYVPFMDDRDLFETIFDNKQYDSTKPIEREARISLAKKIDSEVLLREHIEALAFYKCIQKNIKENKLVPLTKDEIAFEISQIINNIYIRFRNGYLNNQIIKIFKDTNLPELVPYFRQGYNSFKEYERELNSMRGEDVREEGEEKEGEEKEGEPEEYELDLNLPEAYEMIHAPPPPPQLLGRHPPELQALREGAQTPEEVREAMEFAGEGKPNRRRGRGRKNKHPTVKGVRQPIDFDDEANDNYYINQ